MRGRNVVIPALLAVAAGVAAGADDRVDYPIDTPLYTLRGPEAPMIALIQTDVEIEYIGDYIELDMKRAKSALRLLGHVDFAESMLLVVNGGRVQGAMLRVESLYEKNGALHVVVVTADPPEQYRDSDFGSPASDVLTPSLVTVLPRFEGPIFVHAYPAEWAISGDLRGVQLIVWTAEIDAGTGEQPDSSGGD
jgi:hypothetical protein